MVTKTELSEVISNDWIWPAAIGRECSNAVQTSQVNPMTTQTLIKPTISGRGTRGLG
jgi:hypothetical protein